ncbi:unnamed protein product [Mycena citricolor]|uniref:Fucose-specific lectin n=1 Tax=Mycena citricolor TaxID=2018698 RepID=A0AAD2HTS3_9AGAR|nr:unnamed protein product [Mycena citricolor]
MAWLRALSVIGLLLSSVRAGPPVSVLSNTVLDSQGIFFVSYDGVVNVNSFQDSAVLTYGNYQFSAWYTASGAAMLGRRSLPSGAWSVLKLPHNLSVSDSHNVISLGCLARKAHLAQLYYTNSEANLASSGNSWIASRFSAITSTLGTLNVGPFVVTPTNLLQFVYRTGVSGNGATQLAEYSGGVWSSVGSWASASGTYTAPSGATSTLRNLYIHGFTYHQNRVHVSGTWREQNGAVSCSSAGLTNHDTVYFNSDNLGTPLFRVLVALLI